MPYYDFKCDTCHTVYELFMPIREFEQKESGIPCSDECSGTCRPVLGSTPFVPRTNLRISAKQRRKIK